MSLHSAVKSKSKTTTINIQFFKKILFCNVLKLYKKISLVFEIMSVLLQKNNLLYTYIK